MPLLEPTVVTPISTCNDRVQVHSVLTGSEVSVLDSDGEVLGRRRAPWSSCAIPLDRDLRPGERIAAVQEMGGVTSPPPEGWVTTMPGPQTDSEVGLPTTAYPLFDCARSLWVSGAWPGATVQVEFDGDRVADGRSVMGDVRVGLDRVPGPGTAVRIRQEACGLGGPDLVVPVERRPPAEPVRDDGAPSAPFLLRPLQECLRAVAVSGVLPGATVALEIESNGSTQERTASFDAPTLWWNLGGEALELGSRLRVRQGFPDCEVPWSEWSAWQAVEPTTPVPVARVESPLCAGSTTLHLTGLLPGAQFEISTTSGALLGRGESHASSQSVRVPPLPSDTEVVVVQELCGEQSEPAPVPVLGSVDHDRDLEIRQPLLECTTTVVVDGGREGGTAVVIDVDSGAELSSSTRLASGHTVVHVSPALRRGQKVLARVAACGGAEESPDVEVVAAHEVPELTVYAPLEEGEESIFFAGVLLGAVVDVYRDGHWVTRHRGVAEPGPRDERVRLPRPTVVGERYHGHQWLCARRTEEATPVEVTPLPPPRRPELIHPPDGARDVEVDPTFQWRDPGRGGRREAVSFWIDEPTGGGRRSSTTSLRLDRDLDRGQDYEWGVTGRGRTGRTGPRALGRFRTVDARPTPPADPPAVPGTGFSRVDVYNCTTARLTIHLWVRDITSGTPFREVGRLNHQYDAWGTCPPYGARPLSIRFSDEEHLYEVVAVAPGGSICGGQNDPWVASCRRASGIFLSRSGGVVAQAVVG